MEKLYGDEKKDRVPEERFMYVINRAYEQTGRRVVILIDEYDKPMLQAITNPNCRQNSVTRSKLFTVPSSRATAPFILLC